MVKPINNNALRPIKESNATHRNSEKAASPSLLPVKISWGGRFISALKKKLGTFIQSKQTTAPGTTPVKNRTIYRKDKVVERSNDLIRTNPNPVIIANKLNAFFENDSKGEFQAFKAGLDALLNLPVFHGNSVDKQAVTKQIGRNVFNYFEQTLKLCTDREALTHIESTLQDVLKQQILAKQQEKLLTDLISKTQKNIDLKYLRGKRGNKKRHETRRVQLIKMRFLNNKEDFEEYEKARNKKIEKQHSFARAEELVIKKKANAKKVATFFNEHFSCIGAEKPDYEHDPFREAVREIDNLKNRPEVGEEIVYPSKNKNANKLLVLDIKKYHEINNNMIVNFCREVVENCFEQEATVHLTDIVVEMEKEGLISSELAVKMTELIQIRKIEIDIYFHSGHASEVEKQWQALGWIKQYDIKKRVHKASVQYLKDGKSKSSKALFAKDNLERNMMQLIAKYIGADNLKLVLNDNPQTDTPDHALNIRKTQARKKFRWAVNMINCGSNKRYLDSKEYRDARSFFIKNELKKQYGTEFKNNDILLPSAYRAVGNHPAQIFNEGFMPALLSRMSYQKGLLNEPYVNDSAISENKIGWTGGVVSLSDNFLHSAGGVYTATTQQTRKARWIYLVMPAESAEVSQHLHKNADDYAMDAREVMATVITPDRVIAAREVKEDGSLSPLFWNHNADKKLNYSNNSDFVHFINANHLSQVEEREPERRFNSQTKPPSSPETENSFLDVTDSYLHKPDQMETSVAIKNRLQDYALHLKKEKAYYESLKETSPENRAQNRDEAAKPEELELLRWPNRLAADRQEQIARYQQAKMSGK